MSFGLQTSPMKRSNLGLELEMCSMPVNGGCSLCPSTTMMLMMAIFSWTFSTTPIIVDPSSGTIGGPAEVFTETMWRVGLDSRCSGGGRGDCSFHLDCSAPGLD